MSQKFKAIAMKTSNWHISANNNPIFTILLPLDLSK